MTEPHDLRSRDGVLQVEFAVRNDVAPNGSIRTCYVTPDGAQSPTLRVRPGDLLVLRVRNEMVDLADAAGRSTPPIPRGAADRAADVRGAAAADPCRSGAMTATAVNIHFHGLTVPPVCHQDDVLMTSIPPGPSPFEYRVRIPADEPPGLYWYHAHVHGFSTKHVLGGASGALVVEGIERVNGAVAGLPERILVIRDQDLLNPASPPSKSEPIVPKMRVDRDGDAGNNGTGYGKPARDLSINFVPVPYPDYPPARIAMKPRERQLWRVLNASTVTYLNLALLVRREPQQLGVVAVDGVAINHGHPQPAGIAWVDHVGVPPGARVEFLVEGPPAGLPGLLVTRFVDTGQGGENDPNRAIAEIRSSDDAPDVASRLPTDRSPGDDPAAARPWLGDAAPIRVRRFYFSEWPSDPANPNGAMQFAITEEGRKAAPFDPVGARPDVVVKSGDVEDWIIENRTPELHAFHIHQLHFQVREWSGVEVDESFLRDTVNVPYYNGRALQYPSVRLRMDFRDPNIVGDFVYHCHLLEHEDGGMMGTVRVEADPARLSIAERVESTWRGFRKRLHEALGRDDPAIDEALGASVCRAERNPRPPGRARVN
ncbi:MAG TPA: multicopper oxidase domain-containing protein [Burkholderiaceae bacterium]|nr:multicopper oxidase domain-containing protein [Burkholderiaceae bacterium]